MIVSGTSFITGIVLPYVKDNAEWIQEHLHLTDGQFTCVMLVLAVFAGLPEIYHRLRGGEVPPDPQDPRFITTLPDNPKEFVPRKKDLKKICKKVKKDHLVLVSGFGGIGKTTLAKKIFFKIQRKYNLCGWIRYGGELKKDFCEAVSWDEIKTSKEKLAEWWTEFSTKMTNHNERKLFVIDNVDNASPAEQELLKEIAAWPNTSILLTSRQGEIEGFEPYPIDSLSEEDCVNLFYLYYKEDSKREQIKNVKELIGLARNHTLTIEILAKSAKKKDKQGISLSEYYEEIKESFKASDLEVPANRDNLNETIENHLKALFKLSEKTDAERSVLWDFAVIPTDEKLKIGELKEWFGHKERELDRLTESGWLSLKEGVFSMHPLVRRIIRFDAVPENTAAHFLDYLEANKEFFNLNEEGYIITQRKLGIADSVYESIREEKNTLRFAHIAHNMADAHRKFGGYEKAQKLYEIAVEIKEKVLGKEHSDTATTYNSRALLYEDLGKYAEAEEYYKKALVVYEKVLGKERRNTATTYNNLAGSYYKRGKYEEAEEYYKKALEIREKVLGKEHSDTAGTYNNLAVLYEDLGEYEKAEEYYKKALVVYEKVPGKEDTRTATIYNNLAGLYYKRGKYEEAEEYYKKALVIVEKVLGKEHSDTAGTYNNLAELYKNQGRYEEAEEYYNEALVIYEKVLRKKHPDTASTYSNLAGLYYKQGKYEEAEEYYKKALDICMKELGMDHPNTQTVLESYFCLQWAKWKKLGKPDGDFKKWLEKVVSTDQKTDPEKN